MSRRACCSAGQRQPARRVRGRRASPMGSSARPLARSCSRSARSSSCGSRTTARYRGDRPRARARRVRRGDKITELELGRRMMTSRISTRSSTTSRSDGEQVRAAAGAPRLGERAAGRRWQSRIASATATVRGSRPSSRCCGFAGLRRGVEEAGAITLATALALRRIDAGASSPRGAATPTSSAQRFLSRCSSMRASLAASVWFGLIGSTSWKCASASRLAAEHALDAAEVEARGRRAIVGVGGTLERLAGVAPRPRSCRARPRTSPTRGSAWYSVSFGWSSTASLNARSPARADRGAAPSRRA